jgi:serine/threonine protein phosphatase PrpC
MRFYDMSLEQWRSLKAEDVLKNIDSWADNAFREQGYSLPANAHPEENQDSWYCLPRVQIAAVFDGMGGYAGGAQASKAALAGLCAMIPELDSYPERKKWAQDTFENIASSVRASKRFATSFKKQAQDTTGVMLCIADGKALVLKEGDTRAYRLRDGVLQKLTDDFVYLKEDPVMSENVRLLDEATSLEDFEGKEEALYRFRRRYKVDSAMSMLNFPTVFEFDAIEGDLFLLTSDGVHDNLTTGEIQKVAARVWQQTFDPYQVSFHLVQAARERASSEHLRAKDDDITACCLVA